MHTILTKQLGELRGNGKKRENTVKNECTREKLPISLSRRERLYPLDLHPLSSSYVAHR